MQPIPIIEHPQLKPFITRNLLRSLPPAVSEQFAVYIETHYPWLPSHINWEQVPNSLLLRWDMASLDDIRDFFAETTLRDYETVALCYRRREPCLMGRQQFVLTNLTTLLGFGGGPYYIFGTHRSDPIRYVFEHFVELQPTSWIYGRSAT